MTEPIGFFSDNSRQSWGRVLSADQLIAHPSDGEQLAISFASATSNGHKVIGSGLGRSYGDSALNPGGCIIDTTRLDRFINFNPETGLLRGQAGLSLSEILKTAVPRGWFLPTVPGTRFVTLAGAIANDVHGKNHAKMGTFGRHVQRIGLLRSDMGRVEVAPTSHPALFAATIGGLGLTGLIVWAEIQLTKIPSAWLEQELLPIRNIDEFFSITAESEDAFEHTVAWIDCTAHGKEIGRGHFVRANWAPMGSFMVHRDDTIYSMPFDAPSWALNTFTLKVFNSAYSYYSNTMKSRRSIQHYASAFFPLDAIRNWNRLYGRRGFYQYQCVVPVKDARTSVTKLLQEIATSKTGSFLAVLKMFGPTASPGLLSFPLHGVTLALDFKNRGQVTLDLLARLDAIVAEVGGRLYPAKDGRMPAEMFQAGYPNWRDFLDYVDPELSSAFWRRVTQGENRI